MIQRFAETKHLGCASLLFLTILNLPEVGITQERTTLSPEETHVAVPDEIIRSSFQETHDGFSSDEVMVQQTLRDGLIAAIETKLTHRLTAVERTAVWWRLLNLRKAGQLTIATTKRGRRVDAAIVPVSEIAARVVMDRHQVTSDEILVSDELRDELKIEAQKIAPSADIDSVAKAVLGLRKRRVLRPELVLTVANWGREVRTYQIAELRAAIDRGEIPEQPGIYLFRNADGYLYVGEAANLVNRLSEHLGGSDRQSLADHLAIESDQTSVELHIFPSDSPARKVSMRRAYESELIRSRNPKFNVRP